jgi:hypothetical protein
MQLETIARSETEEPGACSISIIEALNVDMRNGPSQLSQIPDEMIGSAALNLSPSEREATIMQLREDMWLGGDENDVHIGVCCSNSQQWFVLCTTIRAAPKLAAMFAGPIIHGAQEASA